MSSLPSGSMGSTGTTHNATVITAHRVDGTHERPTHHAVSFLMLVMIGWVAWRAWTWMRGTEVVPYPEAAATPVSVR